MLLYNEVDSVECYDCKCTECENEFQLPCRLVRNKLEFCPVCGSKITEFKDMDN